MPGKNLRPFHGKPLIVWTVEAALVAALGAEVVVSTDSEEIARIAESAGALVPFLRPSELGSDSASSVDVALHALGALGGSARFETLVLLQPTSPLRQSDDISQAMRLFRSSAADALVSVSPPSPTDYYLTIDSAGFGLPLASGDPVAKLNGAIYVVRTAVLESERSFLPPRTVTFPMPAERSVDIDREEDWTLAERLL